MRKDLERLEEAGHGIILNKNFIKIKQYLAHIMCHMASKFQQNISDQVENRMVWMENTLLKTNELLGNLRHWYILNNCNGVR